MEIKRFSQIILKRLWLVILLPIILSGAMGFYTIKSYTPQYQAKTTLYIMGRSIARQQATMQEDLQITQFLVNDYRGFMKSRLITNTIIEALNLKGITSEQLAEKISVRAKEGTRIIEISVIYENPETARDIANKAGEVFAERAVEVMRVDNVDTIDKALTPTSPMNSKPYKNISIVFLAGICIAVAVILFMEYLDDTVKTKEDIENDLGLTVLGIIPVFNIK